VKQPARGGKAKKPTSSQQKKTKGGTVTPRQKPAKQIIFNNNRHQQQPTFELNDSSSDDEQAAGDRRVGAAILDNANRLHAGRGLDQGSSLSAAGGDGFVERSAPVLSTATVSDNNSSNSGDSNKNEINTFMRRLLEPGSTNRTNTNRNKVAKKAKEELYRYYVRQMRLRDKASINLVNINNSKDCTG